MSDVGLSMDYPCETLGDFHCETKPPMSGPPVDDVCLRISDDGLVDPVTDVLNGLEVHSDKVYTTYVTC